MITADEIIADLQKVMPQLEGLHLKRLQEVVERLKNGGYPEIDRMIPAEDLMYDLRAIGFPDLANKLMKGDSRYGR